MLRLSICPQWYADVTYFCACTQLVVYEQGVRVRAGRDGRPLPRGPAYISICPSRCANLTSVLLLRMQLVVYEAYELAETDGRSPKAASFAVLLSKAGG